MDKDGCIQQIEIRGLDEDGYLKGRTTDGTNRTISLQPDGNTFDMMKNLISVKH
jgi:hypothetical protein